MKKKFMQISELKGLFEAVGIPFQHDEPKVIAFYEHMLALYYLAHYLQDLERFYLKYGRYSLTPDIRMKLTQIGEVLQRSEKDTDSMIRLIANALVRLEEDTELSPTKTFLLLVLSMKNEIVQALENELDTNTFGVKQLKFPFMRNIR